MGFLDRLRGAQPPGPRARSTDPTELAHSSEFDVDHGLPGAQWMGESRRTAEALAARIEGAPEAYAEAAKIRYGHQGFGTAAILYGKAVDLIHTQYLVLDMQHRQPSPADAWIVDGFVAAVGASLAMHPDAPMDDEVREGTHRLRTIYSMCERVGAPSALYANALGTLAIDASQVRVDDILW
jgi:hypothetical protein